MMGTKLAVDGPCEESWYLAGHAELICSSYRHWFGEELITPGEWGALGRALYDAPFAVVSHGVGSDPVFTYGNRLALGLFGYSWPAFTTLRSRMSAGPEAQDGREALLKVVARDGFITGYRGVRVASDGRRFSIGEVKIWNLIGADGLGRGQAAAFSSWEFL